MWACFALASAVVSTLNVLPSPRCSWSAYLMILLVKNADSHVFFCLKNHQIWVVNEFTESVFLQLTCVGEGFPLKFDVLLCQSCCKIVNS